MLKELEGYDWASAFEYAGDTDGEYGGYGSPDIRSAALVPKVKLDMFTREDVVKLIGISEGENDGPPWLAAGRLADGRWFFLEAGCDYTGWDCQAGGTATVAKTKTELLAYGMTAHDKERLGLA